MKYALFVVEYPESQTDRQAWRCLSEELEAHICTKGSNFQKQTLGVWQISEPEQCAETIYLLQQSCRQNGITSKILYLDDRPSWFVIPKNA